MGTAFREQTQRFLRPAGLGDAVAVTVKVTGKAEGDHRATLDRRAVLATKLDGVLLSGGEGRLIPPPVDECATQRVPIVLGGGQG